MCAVLAAALDRHLVFPDCPTRRQFETFSYLPPLTSDQIARQVDYIVGNGWVPCLEFSDASQAYVSSPSTVRFGAVSAVGLC